MKSPKQIIADQASSSRWDKTYRKLHYKYLNEDFINTKDLLRVIDELHTRIDQLNQKLDQNLNNISAAFNAHTHVAPQAPSGAIPTAPPAGPLTPDLTPIEKKPFEKVETDARNSELISQGPSLAPVGDGLSPQALKATGNAQADVLS